MISDDDDIVREFYDNISKARDRDEWRKGLVEMSSGLRWNCVCVYSLLKLLIILLLLPVVYFIEWKNES